MPSQFAVVWARARVAIWRWRFVAAATGLSALVLGATLGFVDFYMGQDERLGRVEFPISCGWRSQREFTGATALLHLFQYADAEDGYRSIVERDPDCAMAYWGIAMSRLRNPLYTLPSATDAEVARRSLQSGAAATTADRRERAYLAAVAKLFDDDAGRDWPTQEAAYARAMERIVSEYPQDREAKIFDALALNLVAASTEKARNDRARATELLLEVFSKMPDHPGIDHYLTYCLGHARYQPRPFEKGSPIMTPMQRILLAGFAFLALCGLGVFVTFTADFPSGVARPSVIGGPFALTASDGSLVTDHSFRGRWMLIYFGYTHCPNVCPTTLLAISEMLEKLGPLAAQVQPLFVTIDPERDAPEVVGDFTKAFDPRIIGLSGKPPEIASVAKEYRVFYKKVGGESAGEYWMEHTSYIYIMDPSGRYVTLLAGAGAETPDDIALRLRELIAPPLQNDEEKVSGAAGASVAVYSGDP
jgi:protein SCO1/2